MENAAAKKQPRGRPSSYGDRKAFIPPESYGGVTLGQLFNFEPHTVEPGFESRARAPEDNLLLAVLEGAIWTLKYRSTNDAKARRQLKNDRRWLNSDEEYDPFCFVSIAEHFGWDPSWLRKIIKRFIARPLKTKREKLTPIVTNSTKVRLDSRRRKRRA